MDEIRAATDLYNSWPKIKQKEFDSIISETFKKAEYYRQHPEEKPAIAKRANELFEDWKKAKKESDDYRNWCKNREFSLDELNRGTELFEIQNKKFRELNFFCMNHPMEEIQELYLEIQKTLGDKK